MGLAERENKRKQSLVGAMISETPNISDSENEAKNVQDIIFPKEKSETRSRRINLLVTPSVYAQAQKKCNKMGISLNECINQFLTSWTKN